MTYEQLGAFIDNMTDEQLAMEVTIFHAEEWVHPTCLMIVTHDHQEEGFPDMQPVLG